MKVFKQFLAFFVFLLLAVPANAAYDYTTVPGDPLATRIYTLPNGLRVYLGVNRATPRIQTYIAVHAGSKNDPSESTGLAHYLEHLMFKGTSQFGTTDFERESVYLNQIDSLYEVYRGTSDAAQRVAIYHDIDSVSYASSRIAIANEYDKLMAGIGSNSSNAFTAGDVTCYEEDIPNNRLEQWAKVQSDRFQDLVIRGFHTELEAVYEEYNMSLTSDFRTIFRVMHSMLMPTHPYGMQTTIGTQEHLKNPSLLNVKNYYKQYYVPNNVAICMVGDLDYDATIAIIDRYFGSWTPNTNLPELHFPVQTAPKSALDTTLIGYEADMLAMGWLLPGDRSKDELINTVISNLLSNATCGLLDVNLNLKQKMLEAEAFVYNQSDYCVLYLLGIPKQGQNLNQVRDLLLTELKRLANGEFSDELLQAVKDNLLLERMQAFQENEDAAMLMVEAFINGKEWSEVLKLREQLEAISKADIMAYAKAHLGEGYACIYKKQGVPQNTPVEKPKINPIEMNRDKQSDYVGQLLAMPTQAIQPAFVEEGKDYSVRNNVYYRRNTENELFEEYYIYPFGTINEPKLKLAASLLDYAGTNKVSAEAFRSLLYQYACEADVTVSDYQTTISISGLEKNRIQAEQLVQDWLLHAKISKPVYRSVVYDQAQMLVNAKKNQENNLSHLAMYGIFGPGNSSCETFSTQQKLKFKPQQLLRQFSDMISGQRSFVFFYSPSDAPEASCSGLMRQEKCHTKLSTDSTEVLILPYDAQNILMRAIAIDTFAYKHSPQLDAQRMLFNAYFGGGMNTIVFQELRESRALAYSAYATYRTDYNDERPFFFEHIATQRDKMKDCILTFDSITENLPVDEEAFKLAKASMLQSLATKRAPRAEVFGSILTSKWEKRDADYDRQLYAAVEALTIDDLKTFHKMYVAGRKYRYVIVGDPQNLDMDFLHSMGTVRILTQEDVYGF